VPGTTASQRQSLKVVRESTGRARVPQIRFHQAQLEGLVAAADANGVPVFVRIVVSDFACLAVMLRLALQSVDFHDRTIAEFLGALDHQRRRRSGGRWKDACCWHGADRLRVMVRGPAVAAEFVLLFRPQKFTIALHPHCNFAKSQFFDFETIPNRKNKDSDT